MTRPLTLCIDLGGTHIKAEVLAPDGARAGGPLRIATPQPAAPPVVLAALESLARPEHFDRASLGFPGVVRDGVTMNAPNLAPGWSGYPLRAELGARWSRPVRVCNDADLAGLAMIEGVGVELAVTLGTGMGTGLYCDGKLVPNLELGHHPFGDGRTYEERVADKVLAEIGVDAWKGRVLENIAQIRPIWNFRRLYLGGGNARLFRADELPLDVELCDNRAGVLAGVRLWAD
jgi:polyphosphate glucokinase